MNMKNRIKMVIKKIFFIFSFLFFGVSFVFAADLNLTANKTNLSTDDILEIKLSISGQVDNNQVALAGLQNFDIVGRSTSQNVSIINGQMQSQQSQIFDLKPKKGGSFEIQAIAKENGKEVKSQKIKIKVEKSLIEKTKDKLLNNSVDDEKDGANESEEKSADEKNDELKKLLTLNQNEEEKSREKNEAKKDLLKENQSLNNFQKIKKEFGFNSQFWLEFFAIVFLLLGIIFMLLKIKKK